jgi:arabinose-5-phosphate isomerase
MSPFGQAARVHDELSSEDTRESSVAPLDALAEEARQVIRQQARAIQDLSHRIDRNFGRAVGLLFATPGHVIVTGMGKSGHIARKMAATFASTGTPSFFMHPAEAFHGDLGVVTDRDTVVMISYSGETEEMVKLLPHIDRIGAPVISMVGRLESTLGRAAQVALDVSVEREVCPNNLAPTSSTLAALAMGDALGCALIRARSFGAEDFARFHPGGSLGRRLLTRVKDAMHGGDLPVVAPEQLVRESLFTITRGRLGLALVMQGSKLLGLVTDGDLRRAMQRHENVLNMPVSEVMTTRPVTILEDALVADAEKVMRARKLKALVVVNRDGQVSGVLEIFDP